MKFIIWHLNKKKKKKILTGSNISQLLKCHLSDTDIDLQFETKYIVFCANKPVQLHSTFLSEGEG